MNRPSTTPYLALDALFEGGRMFVGAISTAYLIGRGLSLADVAMIKSLQAFVFIFAELPTGLVADIRGHRWSLMCALVSAILGFGFYALGTSLPHFLLAEALTALSLCFWSGAYEAFSIDGAHLEGEKSALDRFFHMNQALNQIAVLGCGFAGGWLATGNMASPYLAAIVLLALALVVVSRMKSGGEGAHAAKPRVTMLAQLKASLAAARGVPSLKWLLVASVLVQAFVQPLLHFWQPFFQDQGFSEKTLGAIFSSYCATSVVVGLVMARLSKFEKLRTPTFTKILFGAAALAFVSMAATRGFASIALFCITQGLLTAARTSLGSRLNENLSGTTRASVLSLNSLISRFGMIASLSVISLASGLGTTGLMRAYALGSVFAVAAVVIFAALARSRRRTPQSVRA